MRNEIKILIAAIVVIIIVLVGAFALGGNKSTQASVTPTPVAVTATPTPTPVPVGTGQGEAATPTAVVSAVPTITPAPTITPNPSPESGVKQTEFGYWITYPPLGPETWSSPHPMPASGYENNTVFFDPTSADIKAPEYIAAGSDEARGTPAVIHRYGDLSGTTTVGIHVIPDENMVYDDSLEGHYYIPVVSYMTQISDSYYQVTFNPGVSERTVYIDAYGIYDHTVEPGALDAGDSPFMGSVKLDIVEVDDGYKIGSNHQFTLTVANNPDQNTVYFEDNEGYLWLEGGTAHASGDLTIDHQDSTTAYVTMWVGREGSKDNAETVDFTPFGVPSQAVTVEPFSFSSEEVSKKLMIAINKDYINTDNGDNMGLDIDDNSNYVAGIYNDFFIYFYDPNT